ncbi:alkaline phosphatase family protein [Gynuella sp.]|uniref:alkaline phosphatase family protein n=1 Tax=Gynuella sp. TaxID=2969146 RepID=UPI003D0F136E
MSSKLQQINHVVVLMLENRSFDNMLGWLYDPDNPEPFRHAPRQQSFAGVSGLSLSNPLPDAFARSGAKVVPYSKTTRMSSPNPDPGEEYYHVNTQLYGQCIPTANRRFPFNRPPYNLPEPLPAEAPMSGFLLDYIHQLQSQPDITSRSLFHPLLNRAMAHCRIPPARKRPDASLYEQIMTGFTPEAVPVLATLAREFAVCDHWFSSIPSQTFGNRSFAHCGTSRGFVNNSPVHKWLLHSAPSIFNRMHEHGRSFGIFYDPEDVLSFTELLQPSIWSLNRHVHDMNTFFDLAYTGQLPDYSFIEPRLMIDNNDQHPPAGIPPYLDPIDVSSVLAGEQLIADVYHALRHGPEWERTLLIITYDEHGGNFDHLPPPSAIAPEKSAPAGEQGFCFDRLGVRVPAVIVSPWVRAGTICQTVFDHTSIIRTLCQRWDLPALTERDKYANSLDELLTLQTARRDYVQVQPRPYHRQTTNKDQPLNPFQRILLMLSVSMVSYCRFKRNRTRFARIKSICAWIHNEWVLMKIKTQGQAVDYLNTQYPYIRQAQDKLQPDGQTIKKRGK